MSFYIGLGNESVCANAPFMNLQRAGLNPALWSIFCFKKVDHSRVDPVRIEDSRDDDPW